MVRLVTTVGAAGGATAVLLPGGPVRPDRPDLEVLAGASALVVVAALTFARRTRDDGPDEELDEGLGEEPGGGLGDGLGEGSADGPGGGPDDRPDDGPGDGLGDGPGGVPGDGLGDRPGDRPDDGLADGPGSGLSAGPDDGPGDEPDNGPGGGPDDEPDNGPDRRSRLAARWLAVGRLAADRPAAGRLASGLLAAGAAVWAVFLLVEDLASGLPGASTAVLASSATVTVISLVADAVRPVRLSLAGPLVVVLVVAAVAGGLLAPRLPVRASEATAVEPPALAREPGERRWTWRTSDAVRGVVAAGAGVVVAVDGGALTALDGPTGAVRWHYGRPGARLRALVSTPDRTGVVAAFAPGGKRVTGAALLVVLDAITGRVLRESIVDDTLTDPDFLVPTDTTLPVHDRNTIRTTDLRTGAHLWTWSPPPGCTAPVHLPRSGADVVLTALRCGDRAGIAALDERSGDQRWERMVDLPPNSPADHYLSTSPDGTVVSVRLTGTDLDVLLRTEDGDELTEVDRSAAVALGTHPLLTGEPTDEVGPEIVDPATGERTELPTATCEDPRAEATTASAYLRVCGPDADADLVWQDFAGDGQVTRTPIGWGASAAIPSTMLGSRAHALVLPAPGAIVVARAGDEMITGYPG